MTETQEAEAAQRGRPRPDATVTRDARVLEYLTANGAKTRAELATALEIGGNEVYLSLYRLSRATPPAVEKRGNRWATPGTPEAPTPTE